jgi:hypothetical protein
MEKNSAQRRLVELTRSFNEAWDNLCGKSVELETDAGTPFVAKARMAKKRGSSVSEEVLVFLRSGENGKLKECSRCYSEDWGYYFNHLGNYGQRIGMFCKALDNWFLQN